MNKVRTLSIISNILEEAVEQGNLESKDSGSIMSDIGKRWKG